MKRFLKHPGAPIASRLAAAVAIGGIVVLAGAGTASAIATDDELDETTARHGGNIAHCDAEVASKSFEDTFECGDVLFAERFNAADGAGANVGDGGRFSRVPRADLDGPGQWASHFPPRATGPNSASCATCHNQPVEDGAGEVALNAIRDPFHTGEPGGFIQRNPPHVLGSGGLQRLAEEMNDELEEQKATGILLACSQASLRAAAQANDGDSDSDSDLGHGPRGRFTVKQQLTAKGMDFGYLKIKAWYKNNRCRTAITPRVVGIDRDLVIKPLQWKGSDATLRRFNQGAFHNELGMQPVELVGFDVDGDGDGVTNEINIADSTAMAIYLAGQPRPVTTVELSDLRDELIADFGAAGEEEADHLGLPELSDDEKAQIAAGEVTFGSVECTSCHKPFMLLEDPTFSEPSANPNYAEEVFPSGLVAAEVGAGQDDAVVFDMATENFVNDIFVGATLVKRLGNFETDADGNAIVRLWGDLMRHHMGSRLRENIDEVGTGRANWMTKELWGVGSSDQYLHDGRATTLTEAILEHGGEAQASRDAYEALSDDDKDDVIAFLNSLVLFKVEEEEE